MVFGLCQLPTDESVAPQELARLAEDHGFESLLFAEHTHIPASRLSPYPGGGELPRPYTRTLDPFVALTAAALATERLRVGTGICLVIQRDPIITAKEVASLDHLCSGRFVFGVGAGWNFEEMQDHGTNPQQRFSVMRERVEAMKAIWTEQEASYGGSYVAFEGIWSDPKPWQKPHPPVLVGGNGPTVLDRVLAYGDGWLPNAARRGPDLVPRIEELRRRGADTGRDVSVSAYGAPAEAAALDRLRAAGADRCIFWVPSKPRPQIEQRLDELTALISELHTAGA